MLIHQNFLFNFTRYTWYTVTHIRYSYNICLELDLHLWFCQWDYLPWIHFPFLQIKRNSRILKAYLQAVTVLNPLLVFLPYFLKNEFRDTFTLK